MKRIILVILVLIVVLAGGTFLYRGISSGEAADGQPPKGKKAPQVQVVSATRSTISEVLELTGSTEPYRVAQLASPAEGPVINLHVREGDRVTAGNTLLSIGRKQGVDALVVSLHEDLKKEEENLRRTRQLVESDALPGEQLDQATAEYERVKAQLIKAEESVLDYSIIAPWDGLVSRVMVKDGNFVSPRAPLLEIYDPASLVIHAAVPEKYAVEIHKEMVVMVDLDAFSGVVFQGRVVRIYPYLDERMRTRTIEIEVIDPPELLPGMFTHLKLNLFIAEDALIVPTKAVIVSSKGDQAVFLVENGKTVLRPVKTGIEQGNQVQIISGIEPGDKVVVAGNEKLKDGMEVRLAEPGKASSISGDPVQKGGVKQ